MKTKTNNRRIQAMSLLLAGTLAFALSGCGETERQTAGGTGSTAAAENKQLDLMLHFKSATLDPNNDFTPLRAGVTETLVKLDSSQKLEGWLAAQWEAKDALTWVFTIRDGVTFQDGTRLDAAAAKASLERAAAANKSIAGALKLASMEAQGQQLTIRTSVPNPALPSELVNPYASILSVAAEQQLGKEAFNLAPVGTGPFKVKKFTPNVEVQLERYDGYWGGQPKLQGAVVKYNEDANVRALALQSGEADIAYGLPAESIEAVKKKESLKVESLSGLRVHYLLYNHQKPALQDIRVRQALNLLLNRESAAKDVMLGNGTPANGPFNSELPFGSRAPVTAMDTAAAKALLEEAGYQAGPDGKLSKDGRPLTLELITYKARPELPLIAQLFQSDAAKAGVTVTIKMVDNADTHLKENKDWDLATYSNLSAPRGDGGFYLNTAYMPGGALNPGKIDIPQLKAKIEQLNGTQEEAARIRLTQEAVEIINQEVPHSFAVYPNLVVGIDKRVTAWSPGREEYYILTHTMDVN